MLMMIKSQRILRNHRELNQGLNLPAVQDLTQKRRKRKKKRVKNRKIKKRREKKTSRKRGIGIGIGKKIQIKNSPKITSPTG